MAAAKKDNKPNKKRKEDRHSFIPKPDEATGPFPEALLLREVSEFWVLYVLVLCVGLLEFCHFLKDAKLYILCCVYCSNLDINCWND